VVEVVERMGPMIHEVPRGQRGAPVRCAVRDARVRGDVGDSGDAGDVNGEIPRALTLTLSAITRAAKEVVQELEPDLDPETLTAQRVWRTLRKMCWRAERTSKAVNPVEPERRTAVYGVD